VGNACQQGHSIQVQGRDNAGLEGPVAQTSGSSGTCPPPPQPTVTRIMNRDATGHLGQSPGSVRCLGPRCRFIDVQVSNFPAGVPVTCTVLGRSGSPITTDGSGSAFFQWGWYSGTPEVEIATCRGGGVTASG